MLKKILIRFNEKTYQIYGCLQYPGYTNYNLFIICFLFRNNVPFSGLDIGNKTQYPGLDGTHCVTIMGLPYFGKYFT